MLMRHYRTINYVARGFWIGRDAVILALSVAPCVDEIRSASRGSRVAHARVAPRVPWSGSPIEPLSPRTGTHMPMRLLHVKALKIR